MGGNGQSAGHGTRKLIARGKPKAAPQNAPKPQPATATLAQMQALAAKSGAQADANLQAALQDAIKNTTITNPRLDDGDTQKFFVAAGLADKKPIIVADEDALEAAINAGGQSKAYPYYIFHSDAAPDAITGREFAGQLMGNDTHYISAGRIGDGTYFTTSPMGSAGYMNQYGQQVKAIYNSNARIISQLDLTNRIRQFRRSHPQAAAFIDSLQGSKDNSWGRSAKQTVYAALFGYNVITDGDGSKNTDSYSVCIDRSALTIVKKTQGKPTGRKKMWKYQNYREN